MKIFTTLLLALMLFLSGCVESQSIRSDKPFKEKELSVCLAVLTDMSGSFASSWDGRAHSLLMRLLDELFTVGVGDESRVVLGQLSGSGPVVLFEGKPAELRQKFKSPDDLMTFLKANADASASRVHESTRTIVCLLYTSPSPRDRTRSRMPSSA